MVVPKDSASALVLNRILQQKIKGLLQRLEKDKDSFENPKQKTLKECLAKILIYHQKQEILLDKLRI